MSFVPRNYLRDELAKKKLEPTSGNIRDISIESLPAGAQQPLLYDKELIRVLVEGTEEEVRAAITDERTANAQGRNGETLLMKACRSITNEPELGKAWLMDTLLSMKADPMVRCHAHKNMLHDLYWTAKPPPKEVLTQMKEVTRLLHKHIGTHHVLELFLAPDHHGYQPVDFLHASQYEAWRETLDLMLLTPSVDQARQNNLSNTTPARKTSDISNIEITHGMVTLGRTPTQLVELLDTKSTALMHLLQSLGTSFLLSEFKDPDYAIVATTAAFCKLTLYQPPEILGQNCRFLQGPGTEITEVDKIRVALARKGACLVNLLNFKKDGSEFRNNLAFIPLHDEHGNAIFSIGIQNCPTAIYTMYFESMEQSCEEAQQEQSVKRPRLEPGPELESTANSMKVMKGFTPAIEILRDLSKKGRALLMHLHNLKAPFLLSDRHDSDCVIICASESFCELTQCSMEEILGHNCRFLQGPMTELAEINKVRVALKTGGSTHVSMANYRKDGSQFTNNLAILPLHNKDGEVTYYIGIQNCPTSLFAFVQTINDCRYGQY